MEPQCWPLFFSQRCSSIVLFCNFIKLTHPLLHFPHLWSFFYYSTKELMFCSVPVWWLIDWFCQKDYTVFIFCFFRRAQHIMSCLCYFTPFYTYYRTFQKCLHSFFFYFNSNLYVFFYIKRKVYHFVIICYCEYLFLAYG